MNGNGWPSVADTGVSVAYIKRSVTAACGCRALSILQNMQPAGQGHPQRYTQHDPNSQSPAEASFCFHPSFLFPDLNNLNFNCLNLIYIILL
ncbi:hypothetical protein J2Z22_003724 [Paenibacillus forsythiae]|uniref:Uncharacterized protein n=1 Tax=Paenibacillus forsythiae TaxID=365616 RepID=A0ABU3HBE7_9BACL|nr:hypothetical protein [Paenibacillus forsythiae]MDT3428133.1 hypothetical protein [Paenibacillus forsythiae]